MRKIIYLILLFYGLMISKTMGQVVLKNGDDFIKVVKSDLVRIECDTAFVVSKNRALYLNDQLDELDELKSIYKDLKVNREVLLNELKKAEKALYHLADRIQHEEALLSANMEDVIEQLDTSLRQFNLNNEQLKENNDLLLHKTEELEQIIKELKKETKHLWWNGVADKVVAFAGGALVGILIAIIFI